MTSRVPFGDLSREAASLRLEVESVVSAVLMRGRFILGPEVIAFEREFGDWLGGAHVIGTNSGTDAITIALLALGVGPGDEVITAANTCAPTAFGILASGATLRLADCDPATLVLTRETVEPAISPRTRAIVPVHLYGGAADMEGLTRLAAEHGLLLVEDCAQAVGTRLRTGLAGRLGDAAAFSFYPTKNLGAYGDAGCVVIGDPAVATKARKLRDHGQSQRDLAEGYGLNSRLDELQAAILRVKLGHLSEWDQRRAKIASFYRDSLEGVLDFPVEPSYLLKHNRHLFVVLVDERDAFREQLAEHGVETLVHYPIPLHRQPALAGIGPTRTELSAADTACRRVVSLPLHPYLTDAEVEMVASAVRGVGSALRRRTLSV